MNPPIHRLLLPLSPDVNHDHVLLPATVLAAWFDASIQIVCSGREHLGEYQALAGGLGSPIEPVLELEEPFEDGLLGHAHAHAPSLIVTTPSAGGLDLARRSTQPVFLVAEGLGHRMPVGPLVVEITGAADDLDALALIAVLAPALDESIRLVVGTNAAASDEEAAGPLADRAAAAAERLHQMGCDVGVDALRAHGLHPLVLVGRTRGATAMVVQQSRLDEPGLVERAIAGGVNIFVAPTVDENVGRAAPFDVDLTRSSEHRAPAGADMEILDRDECLARLGRHSVARIGYVDTGWPSVVPVNYRLHGGDIFIRSLAGGKLRAAERGDTVCLEVDGYDEQLRSGWSVLAHGVLEIIHDAATLRQAWANDPEPWVKSDDWRWLRMVPFSVSGRSVQPGVPVANGAG